MKTILTVCLAASLMACGIQARTEPEVLLDFAHSDGRTVAHRPGSAAVHTIYRGRTEQCGSTRVLALDGHISHIELESTRDVKAAEGITLTAWLCPAKLNANTIIVGRPNPNPGFTTPTIGLYAPSEGRLGMGIWTPQICKLEADATVANGRWIFAACTWDRATARIYINGELKGESPCSGKLPDFQAPFCVGAGNRNNRFFKGLIGELRIYQAALSAAEIESLYRSGRTLYPESPPAASRAAAVSVNSRKNVKSEWREFETKTLGQLEGFTPEQSDTELSRYGGWKARREKASGFFRAAKLNGRWWLIDPDGCRFIHVGVACVRIGNSAKSISAYKELYGSRDKWAAEALALLRANAFNGIGNWSDFDDLRAVPNPMPYTLRGGFLSEFAKTKGMLKPAVGHSGYRGDVPPFFLPDFQEFCEKEAALYRRYRDDPYLLGVFSDNEIIPASLHNFLALDPGDPLLKPSYDAAVAWLKERRGSTEIDPGSVSRLENMEFGAYAFGHYYRIVSAALRRALPDHLYLGSRLHGPCYNNPLIVQACGESADVVSINYYSSWTPDDAAYWERISGKPVMITEFYTKGDDAGLPNTTGAGWTVPTQADRGLFYQNFILSLLESRGCVGWHWFKYMDNDPDNRKADPSNIDSNKGIVTVDFTPYPPLLEAMRAINRQVYPLTEYFDR